MTLLWQNKKLFFLEKNEKYDIESLLPVPVNRSRLYLNYNTWYTLFKQYLFILTMQIQDYLNSVNIPGIVISINKEHLENKINKYIYTNSSSKMKQY